MYLKRENFTIRKLHLNKPDSKKKKNTFLLEDNRITDERNLHDNVKESHPQNNCPGLVCQREINFGCAGPRLWSICYYGLAYSNTFNKSML